MLPSFLTRKFSVIVFNVYKRKLLESAVALPPNIGFIPISNSAKTLGSLVQWCQ